MRVRDYHSDSIVKGEAVIWEITDGRKGNGI